VVPVGKGGKMSGDKKKRDGMVMVRINSLLVVRPLKKKREKKEVVC
jgi:hypothetical protein